MTKLNADASGPGREELEPDPPDAVPTTSPGPGAAASSERADEQDEDDENEIGKPEFRCPNCAAPTTWDPANDSLSCDYCGERTQVPRADGEVIERALEDAGSAARGLGLEQRAVRCNECAATVTLDNTATAGHCVFCGSSNVLPQNLNRNVLRPESLIPLEVSRDTVEEGFRRWVGGLWFRPGALKQLDRFDALGVYVPYWTFDAEVHSEWSADAGHYYYVTRTVPVRVNGKIRMQRQRVRKVRWVPAWGERQDSYDDLLVNASKGVPDKLVAKLGGFDTRGLVPYRPEYLAGWRAEEYQCDLEQAWELARERVLKRQRARCSGDVPGDTQRRLAVHTDIDEVHWKHVLLPMWSLRYEHAGKNYSVLVHGQSGHVVGKAPLSWPKILFTILLVVMVLGVLAFL